MVNNPLPLYAQISDYLKDDIRIGKWQEGEQIPTESDLCHIYGVKNSSLKST